jgi:hypothetical protein
MNFTRWENYQNAGYVVRPFASKKEWIVVFSRSIYNWKNIFPLVSGKIIPHRRDQT